MPQFDLRGIKIADYVNTSGTISYTNAQTAGDDMTAHIELRFAEGRLSAESSLAEYIRKAVGGTLSLGVKYIPDAAQKKLFGLTEKSRTVSGSAAKSLVTSAKSSGAYVGVAFYAPDMIDGAEKFTCVFAHKARFGQPSMSLQTAGESIVFSTPITTSEFMADDGTDKVMLETYTADTEAAATAWITAVLQ